MTRKKINFKTKLCATLCQMRHEVDGKWELIIPHDDAVKMSEDQILSLFQFDHYPIPHAEDGPDEHWNLDPVLIAPHKAKTAKVDTPGIAKRKRVSEKEEEFRRKMLTPRDERPDKKSRWGSRPFPKKRKIR